MGVLCRFVTVNIETPLTLTGESTDISVSILFQSVIFALDGPLVH